MYILVADGSGFLHQFIRHVLDDSFKISCAYTLEETKSILESILFEWLISAASFSDGIVEEMYHRKFRMPPRVAIYTDFQQLNGDRALFLSERVDYLCSTASGMMELLLAIRDSQRVE